MPLTKSAVNSRSPVNLRSKSNKSPSLSQNSIKTSQTLLSKTKSKISTTKSVTSCESSSSDFIALKSIVEAQKRVSDEAFRNLRLELDSKYSKFEAFVKCYENDLLKIKCKQNEVTEMLYTLNATRLNFALPIGFNKSAIDYHNNGNKEFNTNLSILSNRINEIETKISKMDTMLINLSEDALLNILKNNSTVDSISADSSKITEEMCVDKETFRAELECINFELKKMDNIIRTDEMAIKKMNNQLHVLSAKFINFNAKINEHLMEFNRSRNQQIEIDEIIDCDTPPFMVQSRKPAPVRNNFCFENIASNRFQSFEKNENCRLNSIVVRVEFASVNDLNGLVNDIKKQFEHRMGIGSVNQVAIVNYKVVENTIHQFDAIVIFHSSWIFSHLNSIQFPTNWIFFLGMYISAFDRSIQ